MKKSSSRSTRSHGSKQYFWVSSSRDSFPVNAVHGGWCDGNKVFVARAAHEKGMIPGSFSLPQRTTVIAWNGGEYSKCNYEILVSPHGTVDWITYDWREGPLPVNSIVGGHSDIFNEPLYICRCHHNTHVVTSSSSSNVHNVLLGCFQPSRKCCFVPYDGKVLGFYNVCEILVET